MKLAIALATVAIALAAAAQERSSGGPVQAPAVVRYGYATLPVGKQNTTNIVFASPFPRAVGTNYSVEVADVTDAVTAWTVSNQTTNGFALTYSATNGTTINYQAKQNQ